MFSRIRVKNKPVIDMSAVSLEHRVMYLAEQLLAINYLLQASENDNILRAYKQKVTTAIQQEVKNARTVTNIAPLTKNYLTALNTVAHGELIQMPHLHHLFNDFNTFPAKYRTLELGFLEPLFFSISKYKPAGVKDVYHNAILYTPYTVSKKNCKEILLVPELFPTYRMDRLDTSHIDTGNPFMNHLARFSWKGKHINQFTAVLMSFKCHNFGKYRNTVPAVVFNAVRNEVPLSMDKKQAGALKTYLSMVKLLSEQYAIDTSNKTVGRILQAFPKYHKVSAYFNSDPSKRTVGTESLFRMFPELSFLESTNYKVALEAAEDEEDASDDEKKPTDKEETPSKDDDDIEDQGDPDTGSDDSGEDDDLGGFDDDTSTEDPSDTSTYGGSSSGADTTNVAVHDTPPEEEDPSPDALELTIVDQETYDEYIERQALISDIRAVIANPPSGIHSTEVELLKMWLSGWIHMVSVDSTKDLLSLLSVQI